MKPGTRFKKIKHDAKEGRTEIHYEVPMKGDFDAYTVSTREEPHSDFAEALEALAADALQLCELAEIPVGEIVVRGVSFSHGKDGSEGAVITALRRLRSSNAPLVLNTPHKVFELVGEGGDENQLLPHSTIRALERLQEEAEAFLDGKRAQGSLFAAA